MKTFEKPIDIGMHLCYYIVTEREGEHRTEDDMTKAEKTAVKARTKDLIEQGVDRTIAGVMARAELEAGLIKPVVNSCR